VRSARRSATFSIGRPPRTARTAGRLGTTAVFLASDDASFFVGQALAPNGGIFM
jgi:hypothetical protein